MTETQALTSKIDARTNTYLMSYVCWIQLRLVGQTTSLQHQRQTGQKYISL